MPEPQRKKYADKWEDLEADFGHERFSDLFSHLRMIFMKVRLRGNLLTEFEDNVLARYLPDRAIEFVDNVLEQYGKAYRVIVHRAYSSETGDEDSVNQWLHRLHRLDNFDWHAPALWALAHHPHDTEWLTEFLARLDRLGAWMLVSRYTTHGRGQRIAQLLTELDAGAGLDAGALRLSAPEQRDMLDRLDGDIYRVTALRKYLLVRLDEILSDPPVFKHDENAITIEHVLPQNPKADSEWSALFTDDERSSWTHRMANLVLLSRTKNSAAQNFDFAVKKEKYFKTGRKVSSFALTTQVLNEPSWTLDVLRERQRAVLGLLAEHWELNGHAPAESTVD